MSPIKPKTEGFNRNVLRRKKNINIYIIVKFFLVEYQT